MPEPVDFRIGRISDLRLPEGANFAAEFTFSGLSLTGYEATLTARRGANGGRVPFTWSKSGISLTSTTVSFDIGPATTDDAGKAFSTVTAQGSTDYALTIRQSGGGAIVMRLQGTVQWVEDVGDYDPGTSGSNQIAVTVGSGTAVTVSLTNNGHSPLALDATTADVLTVNNQVLSADDAGSDKLLFWDESEGKLSHATIGSGLTMTGTTLSASGGAGTGTVTSVAVSGSDGIEVDSGSPITASGTIALGVNASTLKSHLSINNVENTALSTWAGSTNITTLGTISTGTVPLANVSGKGDAAAKNTGTTAGTVAAGDHTHAQLHDAVTLAGSLDYLTLSGQAITRNAIDLATDVTGTLPVANGGTGQTSLASVDASDFGSGAATDGYVLTADGAGGAAWEAVSGGGGGSGTVTSVAISGTDGIDVDSGSPVTSSGTITLGVNASTLKTHLSLNNVENTALSTWAGSTAITTLGTISTGTVPLANVSGTGDAAAKNTGSTAGTVCAGDDSRLSDARTPTSHVHGNITNAGAIGSTSGLPIKTGTSGVLEAGAFGTSAGQFAEGNHSHSAFTGDSGSGGVAGFVPAPSAGDAAAGKYLDADGTWTVPPAGGGGVSDGDKGDITVSASGATWTIDNGAVSLAKMANMATASLLGRSTAGTGSPEVLSASTARSLLNVADGANNYSHPNHTGDVTSTGDGATTIANDAVTTAKIINDAVTYAKIQNISATSRVLGRKGAGAGDAEECTLSEVLDFVGSAAQGDILYRGASSWTRLAAGTSGQFLKTQGAGANLIWDSPSGGGGGWTLIDSGTVSSVSSVVEDGCFTDSYDEYQLVLINVRTGTDSVMWHLRLRASNADITATYDAAYHGRTFGGSAASAQGPNNNTGWRILGSDGTGTDESCNAIFHFWPRLGVEQRMIFSSIGRDYLGAATHWVGGGAIVNHTTDVDGFKILPAFGSYNVSLTWKLFAR